MRKYIGEEDLKIKDTEYALYTSVGWSMLWIEMYSGIDGAHHKDWLLDQVSRILKGTEIIIKKAMWDDGFEELRFSLKEPPSNYWDWVKEMKKGEDGDETYDYDFGIAP